ncbi:iron complex transport system substrate-binding protein [Marmoricola sp. OAE513]|uniref:ABC transporter substrate-binding protein n=1 Tax=Marmoricola sp. OAE513 TaxID=2817894 RepID=UPI001AE3B0DC
MRTTRLAALVSAAALAATALSACGSSDDDSSKSTDSSWTPVSIETKFGTTEIKKRPERIVTIGLTDQDAVLALGTVPVAVTNWFGNAPGRIFPWAEDALKNAENNPLKKGEVPEVLQDEKQTEKVLALKPDLITAMYSGLTQEQYDTFTAAGVPVVAPPKGNVDYGTPWQDATTIIGEAMGKKAEAEALVKGVDDKVAAAAAEHPEFEGKSAVTITNYEGFFIYGASDPRGRLLSDLGFVLPKELDDFTKKNFGKSISAENASKIDLDVLLWVNSEKKALELKTYAGTKVHQNGGDVFIDDTDQNGPLYIASSFVTVLSLPFYLDEIVPRLAAAADGDPSTKTD